MTDETTAPQTVRPAMRGLARSGMRPAAYVTRPGGKATEVSTAPKADKAPAKGAPGGRRKGSAKPKQ